MPFRRDLHSLKRPASTLMSRKHEMRPWEDQAVALEAMAKKEDAAAFAFGSHNKKRPGKAFIAASRSKYVLGHYLTAGVVANRSH
jgi:hypothetical protein